MPQTEPYAVGKHCVECYEQAREIVKADYSTWDFRPDSYSLCHECYISIVDRHNYKEDFARLWH